MEFVDIKFRFPFTPTDLQMPPVMASRTDDAEDSSMSSIPSDQFD